MHIPGLLEVKIVAGKQSWEFEPPFPGEFCRLGNIGSNGLESIELKTTLDSDLVPIHVDGAKNVSRIRIKKGVSSIRMGLRREERNTTAFSIYPENHLRLLSLSEERIAMWEAAIVSQRGTFFLTFQETVNIALKEGIGGILYGMASQLQKWPQMKAFLENLLGKQLLILAEENPRKIREWRVIWYNLAQGMGAIQTPKGAARVHWSKVDPRKSFQYLIQGESVQCRIVPVVQRKGIRPTSFKLEAESITLR